MLMDNGSWLPFMRNSWTDKMFQYWWPLSLFYLLSMLIKSVANRVLSLFIIHSFLTDEALWDVTMFIIVSELVLWLDERLSSPPAPITYELCTVLRTVPIIRLPYNTHITHMYLKENLKLLINNMFQTVFVGVSGINLKTLAYQSFVCYGLVNRAGAETLRFLDWLFCASSYVELWS